MTLTISPLSMFLMTLMVSKSGYIYIIACPSNVICLMFISWWDMSSMFLEDYSAIFCWVLILSYHVMSYLSYHIIYQGYILLGWYQCWYWPWSCGWGIVCQVSPMLSYSFPLPILYFLERNHHSQFTARSRKELCFIFLRIELST